MTWTMGMIERQAELSHRSEQAAGMERVYHKLRELNSLYCWCPDTKETLWPIVNRMLWRFCAMYYGGDCHIAEFPGYAPGERLWHKGRNRMADEFATRRNESQPKRDQ